MKEFIKELENNQKINLEKGLENKVDIDYVIERLKDIDMNNYDVLGFDKEKELTRLYNKGFDKLREQSLEDVYNVLCKNEPSKNSKKHKEWDYLESIAYEELLIEDEHPNECTALINEIVDYLEEDWKNANK